MFEQESRPECDRQRQQFQPGGVDERQGDQPRPTALAEPVLNEVADFWPEPQGGHAKVCERDGEVHQRRRDLQTLVALHVRRRGCRFRGRAFERWRGHKVDYMSGALAEPLTKHREPGTSLAAANPALQDQVGAIVLSSRWLSIPASW